MKTKLRWAVLVCALCGLAGQVQAQDKAINVGFKLSPSISWMGSNNNHLEGDGAKFKGGGGVVVAFNFTDNLAVVSGLNASATGGKLALKADEGKFSLDAINFTELELPVLFQMKTNEIGALRYYAKVGLGVKSILQARDDDKEKLSKKLYNTIGATYIIAAGVEYPLTSGNIALFGELQFDGSLSSTIRAKNIKKEWGVSDAHARVNVLELSVGVMF